MEPIRCEQLCKHYGKVQALQPLDLNVPVGAIFGFLGRNGAGKTTTMRLLAGLAHPTSGRAWVGSVETTRADSAARSVVGYLPQDPAFYNWMTPTEYLNYMASVFGMAQAERSGRVDEMLELVGLKSAARRRIGGFSGGMHQRLGIAQALIHRPPVLLLDEPTSALDPAGRHEVLELIAGLRGQVTVFFSSHILADVERICDTIGIIHEGRLLLVADREELLAQHAKPIISIQVEQQSVAQLPAFVAHVQAQAWATLVTALENTVQIVVSDRVAAQQALLPLVVEHQLLLLRFEWARPTLEQVFLSISV
jgi:ABC-2 type transport system ATP-binding protein